ncbi:hypothetical protein ES702_06266 [subsurface metagenome]
MGVSKICRIAFRIALYVMTISLTLTGLFGGLSAVAVFSDFSENVKIPSGPITAQLNFSEPMRLVIPFNLTNAGYFPLDELRIGIAINMTYNVSLSHIIMQKEQVYPEIGAGVEFEGNFTATDESFSIPSGDIDIFHPPTFTMNLNISAYYTFRLLFFGLELKNIPLSLGGP